ncbi:hypothetical protein DFH07DRAFT_848700 [Mycena maculata]|uniref:DUF4470 domain-containing protein n=1 Tax=Mycena maculata TaxID=230809 RepID=A0AAD7MRX9_9AGAR|nr:hypothetical protein DFH07DRAFT_848700 [Mycena maculata]
MAKKSIKKKAANRSASTQVDSAVTEAEGLKEAGRVLYDAGKFSQAAEKYSQAVAHAPLVASYPTNLSAALAKNGQYLEAIDAIRQAEGILASGRPSDDKILRVLSKRLEECLHQAAHFFSDNDGIITSLRAVSNTSEKVQWWDRYDHVHFDALPLRKSAVNTNLEFFTMSHDYFRSLLQEILDSWGTNPERTCPGDSDVSLDQIAPEHQRALNFLFGGVGDARQVFSTFIDICCLPSVLCVAMHFALLDIQPAALARDLVMLYLLWKTPLSKENYDLSVLSAKTAFYLFSCAAMPPDSHALSVA